MEKKSKGGGEGDLDSQPNSLPLPLRMPTTQATKTRNEGGERMKFPLFPLPLPLHFIAFAPTCSQYLNQIKTLAMQAANDDD